MDERYKELLAALVNMVEWLDRAGESKSHSGKEYSYVTTAREAIARAQAWQAEEEEPSKPESPWLGLAYITAIVCACIIGLFALPYMIIFFSGCWRGC